MESTKTPKVFISYSWNPEATKQKIIRFAERLQSEGVHVVIDVWDLAEGQDKNVFMEKMVNDADISKVLIFCTKSYTEKANQRHGGVGTESIIISEEVYSHASQQKFIPIIFEKDENNQPFIPTFIKSRIYIDLFDELEYENNYEQLIRNIFGKPVHKRPPLGSPPSYLSSEEPNRVRTSRKINQIINAIIGEKKITRILIDEYYELFLACLREDYIIDKESIKDNIYDEAVVQMIGRTIDLRDDYLNFISTLVKYDHLDIAKLFSFFETLHQQFIYGKREMIHEYVLNEHRRFLTYEIFIYTIAILMQKERFDDIQHLLYNSFYIFDYDRASEKFVRYTDLLFYSELLNKVRNTRLQLNRVCVVADLIKERATSKEINFDYLKGIDTFLYYIYLINGDDSFNYRWFPYLNAYYSKPLPFISRATSRKYMAKFIKVFNVADLEELKNIIETKNLKGRLINLLDYDIPTIDEGLNLDKLGTIA